MAENNIYELVNRYRGAGFSPFPLAKNSKEPPKGSRLDTIEWDWPFDSESNIGLFAGSPNGLIALDADNNQAKENISTGLKSLGLFEKIPIVLTPHRQMNHFLLRATNVPMNIGAKYNFPTQIGAGDIRIHRNAYVLGPGSVLPDGKYKFIQGSIESFSAQPIIEWKDLLWLLPNYANGLELISNDEILKLPIRLIYRDEPKALYFLTKLRHAEKGEKIQKVDFNTEELLSGYYQSRSEAEEALLTVLILSGWPYEEIEELFRNELPGHYAESNDPDVYFRTSYNNAIRFLSRSIIRYQVATAYRFINSNPWIGRTAEYDNKVLLAIFSKAWQFDTLTPMISLREISEYTAIERPATVKDILVRLQKQKLIKIMETPRFSTSQFNIEEYVESVNNSNINQTSPPMINVTVNDEFSHITSEIWSRNNGMLGGSSKLVYMHLSNVPSKVSQLSNFTGKCRNTIILALDKLRRYNLAQEEKNGWVRGTGSIDSVAEELQVEQAVNKRLEKHRRERFLFKSRKENFYYSKKNTVYYKFDSDT